MLENFERFAIFGIIVVGLCYCLNSQAGSYCPSVEDVAKHIQTISNSNTQYKYPDINRYDDVCTAPYTYQSQSFTAKGREWAILLVDVPRGDRKLLQNTIDTSLGRSLESPSIIFRNGKKKCLYNYSKPYIVATSPAPDIATIQKQVKELMEEKNYCASFG